IRVLVERPSPVSRVGHAQILRSGGQRGHYSCARIRCPASRMLRRRLSDVSRLATSSAYLGRIVLRFDEDHGLRSVHARQAVPAWTTDRPELAQFLLQSLVEAEVL